MPTWLWAEDCSSERRVEGRGCLRSLLCWQPGEEVPSLSTSHCNSICTAQAGVGEHTCLQPQGGISFNWLLTALPWTSPAWLAGLTVDVEMCTESSFLSLWDTEAQRSGCCVNRFLVVVFFLGELYSPAA